MEYNKSMSHYNWLVDVLVEAYMNDTLKAGESCGCGTGNIINAKLKQMGTPSFIVEDLTSKWSFAFQTVKLRKVDTDVQSVDVRSTVVKSNDKYMQVSYEGIGFPFKHLMRQAHEVLGIVELPLDVIMELEWKFETTEIGDSPDEIMFNRLLAAISVLDKYFGVPQVIAQGSKGKFQQVRETRLVTQ